MKRLVLPVSIALCLACTKAPEQQTTTSAEPATAARSQSAPAVAPASNPPQPAPASTTAPAPAPGASLASQETNWKGITADVTEFRRKGNTLTAKVRFSNRGSEETTPEVKYGDVYLIDTGGGKKYNVLRDEKGAYIAALYSGWSDRWWHGMKPSESQVIWIKFPAPPPEIKAITLNLPNTPPFEDVPIQD
jgi:hypothetical protein